MTEQQYLDAIAIYHPSGGHRTGKIYDVTPNANDLTVTGGGGTRINKDGKVEEIVYNILNYSNDFTKFTNTGEGNIASTGHIDPFGSSGASYYVHTGQFSRIQQTQNFGKFINLSFFIKDDDSGINMIPLYSIFNATGRQNIWFDSIGGSVINNNLSDITLVDSGTEDYGNGWFRVWIAVSSPTDITEVRLISADSTSQTTGTRANFYIFGGQVSNGKELKPYQHKTGSAAFPKIDYSTGRPAFLIEPARTNYELYSYNKLSDGAWVIQNGVATLNEIGITGESNTALFLENTTTTEYAQLYMKIRSFSNVVIKATCWIKKDEDESRFPEVFTGMRRAIDSTVVNTIVQINTKTGAMAYRAGANGNPAYVIDRGDWWEVVIISTEPIDRTSMAIRPAMSSTLGGTYTETVTGSIIVGHVGMYNSTVVNETPIITNGAAVTRTEGKISTQPFSAIEGSEKSIFFHIDKDLSQIEPGGLYFISFHRGTSEWLEFNYFNGSFRILYNDGTQSRTKTFSTTPPTTDCKMLLTYNDTELRGFYNGEFSFTLTLSKPINLTSIASNDSIGAGGYRGGQWRLYGLQVFNRMLTDQEAIDLTTI